MSIVQIFDQTAPLVSGYSMRSKYISDSLHALGVPLNVISSPIFQYENKIEEQNGVHYHRCEVKGWSWIKRFPFIKENTLVRHLKTFVLNRFHKDIKLIDAHSSVLNGLAGAKIAEKLNIPFLYEIRALWEDAAVDAGKTKEGSWRYNFTRDLETKVVNKANKVTVICEGLKNDLIERGISEDKITVIPNGVDTDQFIPREKDQEIINKLDLQDKTIIGFIGTFFEFEGVDYLVKAANELLKQRTNVKFLIVGGGRHDAYLKSLVKEFGLENDVIFTGRVPHDDVQRYYSVIDILVYPRISKRITELVTPLKPLEAMALEKIVIGSDVGGIKELVKHEENGLLFKSEDINDLVHTINQALDDFPNMKAMAKRARQYVINERNWLTICKRYLPIFKELGALNENN